MGKKGKGVILGFGVIGFVLVLEIIEIYKCIFWMLFFFIDIVVLEMGFS